MKMLRKLISGAAFMVLTSPALAGEHAIWGQNYRLVWVRENATLFYDHAFRYTKSDCEMLRKAIMYLPNTASA